jgi:hypothetical protein
VPNGHTIRGFSRIRSVTRRIMTIVMLTGFVAIACTTIPEDPPQLSVPNTPGAKPSPETPALPNPDPQPAPQPTDASLGVPSAPDTGWPARNPRAAGEIAFGERLDEPHAPEPPPGPAAASPQAAVVGAPQDAPPDPPPPPEVADATSLYQRAPADAVAPLPEPRRVADPRSAAGRLAPRGASGNRPEQTPVGAYTRGPDQVAGTDAPAPAPTGADAADAADAAADAAGAADAAAGATTGADAAASSIGTPTPSAQSVPDAPRASDSPARQPAPEPAVSPAQAFTSSSGRVASTGQISVILPGDGWVYLGKEHGDGPVTFLRKNPVSDGSEFVFRLDAAGAYRLWFQQQDAATGRVRNERVTLEADPAVQARTVDVATAATASPPAVTGTRAATDADATYSVATTPGSIAVPHSQIDAASEPLAAPPAVREPSPGDSEARTVPDAPPADRDPLEELAHALEAARPQAVLEALDGVDAAGARPGPQHIAQAAALLTNTAPQRATALYRTYLRDPSGDVSPDQARIALARLLESEGPQRNLREALAHYQTVRDEYPLSPYWEEAESRYQHLRRHFFDLR